MQGTSQNLHGARLWGLDLLRERATSSKHEHLSWRCCTVPLLWYCPWPLAALAQILL